MYASFHGLQREPFSIAPDPRFLYMSDAHREALAHLLYGLAGGGGFVLLTGEIGAGKTTVCRCFLQQVPAHCDVAYVFNPKLGVVELLQTVCDEFRVEVPPGTATVKGYVDALNRFLLAAHAGGRHAVLVIDEAQALAPDVLEQLRLLTNLETNERKLLQIVLIGQPELRAMLARPELEQLAQRVVARYHLPALSAAETAAYVGHRLAVAGLAGASPFDADALAALHRIAGGVPRRINLLADRALLGAYATGQRRVGRAIVETAAHEVFGTAPAGEAGAARRPAVVAVLAIAAAAVGVLVWQAGRGDAVDVAPAVAAAASAAPRTAVERRAPEPRPAPASALAATARGSGSAGGAAAGTPRLRGRDAGADTPTVDAATLLARAAPTEAAGWRLLGARWGADAAPGEPCAAFAASGLACWRTTTGLARIRELGRPGLLALRGADGRRGWALLTGLDADTATLEVDAGRVRIPLAQLAGLWRGEFATLWRPPPGWSSGARDAAALSAWLDGRLPGDGDVAARLLAFQIARGLEPDGRAGPLTLMRLNPGGDEPRLSPAP